MSRNPSDAAVKAWTRLIRARDRVLGAIEQDLEAGDCPPLAWYDVLLELSRAADGRLRPFEIEKETLLAQYNLSRLLDRLEKEGLVAREPCAGRRAWPVGGDHREGPRRRRRAPGRSTRARSRSMSAKSSTTRRPDAGRAAWAPYGGMTHPRVPP